MINQDYETKRLVLKEITIDEAYILQDYLLKNKGFLEEWEPKHEENYYEYEQIKKRIVDREQEIKAGRALTKHLFLKSNGDLIGTIALNNIVYGAFWSGFLGYKLCNEYKNKGYMTEALITFVDIAFNEYKLHRIEANIMPKNTNSKKVLVKCGFEYEGMSRKYLKINGKWEDHEHYVKLNKKIE